MADREIDASNVIDQTISPKGLTSMDHRLDASLTQNERINIYG